MKLIFVDMPLRPISKNTIFNHQSISSTQGCYISAPVIALCQLLLESVIQMKQRGQGKAEEKHRNTDVKEQ